MNRSKYTCKNRVKKRESSSKFNGFRCSKLIKRNSCKRWKQDKVIIKLNAIEKA